MVSNTVRAHAAEGKNFAQANPGPKNGGRDPGGQMIGARKSLGERPAEFKRSIIK